MRADTLPEAYWPRLVEVIAAHTGLSFPPERRPDLQRGLAEAATEFGFPSLSGCADWLLSAPLTASQLNTLAGHLTIGETYFFRERNAFNALAGKVLAELIQRRRGKEQRLRLWSAACSTGEEPYSLAILLHELLPDWSDWQVTILATDINTRFLQKAAAGVYGEWSFRGAEPGFKERYFTPSADRRFAVLPQIRQRVSFAQLNLAGDGFPSGAADTRGMDVIFCRNLLIYFTPAHARKLVDNLYDALSDEGWLVVSPGECSQVLFSRFVAVNFPGAILYRKGKRDDTATPTVFALPEPPQPRFSDIPSAGRPDAGVEVDSSIDPPDPGPPAFSLLSRAFANQGKLRDALAWNERWIAADKLNPVAHYLYAMVLVELGERVAARRALQKAVYLQPDFVLAHFALGNCARGDARSAAANKHYANALRLAQALPEEKPLPESDGLSAGRLAQIIAALAPSDTSCK